MRFLFLIAIAFAGYLIYKLYFQQLLAQGRAGKIKLGLIALGLVFLAMAVTGRTHIIFGLIGAAMTQVMRLAPLLIKFAPFLSKYIGVGSPIPGMGSQSESRVKTNSLIMTLNHETGEMDGEILVGALTGKRLKDLIDSELKSFYLDCQETDPDAVRLLQAYISRERPNLADEENTSEQNEPHKLGDSVTVREAYDILGLEQGATKKDIVRAHRKLMLQFHPDKGGSNYLASKVNEAKKVLTAHVTDE